MHGTQFPKYSLSLLALIVSTPLLAQPVTASADASSLASSATAEPKSTDDIVVTARRVAEDIQRVPVSVTAVSPEKIRQQNIVDVVALSRVTPSFTATKSTRGGGAVQVMIRGQRSNLAGMLNEPAVTVYFADVGQSLAAGTNSSLFDLASVQILKGPQGTLFGRNTTGGAVLLTPKAPGDRLDGYLQLSGGGYRLRDVEGALNIPLSDTLSIRAAGKITRRRGYMYNPYRNDYAENQHSDSARLSIRWAPTSDFESTTLGIYSKEDVENTKKLFVIVPGRLLPALNSSGLLTTAAARLNALGPYGYDDTVPQIAQTRVYGIQNTSQVKLESGLDSLSVKNIAAYRNVKQLVDFDTAGINASVIETLTPSQASVYSDEFQIAGSAGNFSFLTGLFYYQLDGYERPRGSNYALLQGVTPASFPSISYGDYDVHNESYAAFAHGEYKLDALVNGLSISAGARVTKDTRGVTYHNRSSAGANPTTFRCVLTGAVNTSNDPSLCVYRADTVTYTEPTYDVSLNWQANRDVLIYGAFRHGYRAGGFNASPASGSAVAGSVFAPEKIDDFEIGLKTEFTAGGMRGRFNLAGYYDKLHNLQRQISQIVPGTNQLGGRVVNAATGHILGGEAALTLNPTDALGLSFGGSIIDAKYDNFIDNYTVGGVITPVDVSDSKFAFVPKYQVNASARYELPIPEALGKLALQASYYYQSKIATAEINTRNCGPDGLYAGCTNYLGALPGYDLVNARIDWRNVAGQGFDLAVFVNNVFDKLYYPDATTPINAVGFASRSVGEPRMWGLELRVPFGASAY